MAFKYVRRSQETVAARAAGQGGDFKGFLANEYTTFSPKKGSNWIRILPPTWDEAPHYGLEVDVHYGVGPDRASVLCNAKMFKTKCPICEAHNKAQKAGDEELAKELRASTRVVVWLLDRNEKDKGPLLYAMPMSMDKDICKISMDKQTGEVFAIDDPEGGYNVSFDKDGEGMKTKYAGYQLDRRASSVEAVHLDYISNHPITGCLVERTYDEVLALFQGAQEEEKKPAETRRGPPADERTSLSKELDDEIPFLMETPAGTKIGGSLRRVPTSALSAPSSAQPELTDAQKKAQAMRDRFKK